TRRGATPSARTYPARSSSPTTAWNSERRIRSMSHRIGSLVAALAVTLAALSGRAAAQEAKQLRIVKQPGLGYLQLIVMRELKLIEKRAPGVEIEWRQLTSGPVIRDAMIAGQMD